MRQRTSLLTPVPLARVPNASKGFFLEPRVRLLLAAFIFCSKWRTAAVWPQNKNCSPRRDWPYRAKYRCIGAGRLGVRSARARAAHQGVPLSPLFHFHPWEILLSAALLLVPRGVCLLGCDGDGRNLHGARNTFGDPNSLRLEKLESHLDLSSYPFFSWPQKAHSRHVDFVS